MSVNFQKLFKTFFAFFIWPLKKILADYKQTNK